MSTSKTPEEEFDDYLDGGTDLSRLYRDSARDEPSAPVDEIILAAAGDAVRPGAATRRRPVRWMVPLALAATVVLSVSLVTLLPQEPWRTSDPALEEPADVGQRRARTSTVEPTAGGRAGAPRAPKPAQSPARRSGAPAAPPAAEPEPRRSPLGVENGRRDDATSLRDASRPVEQRAREQSAPASKSLATEADAHRREAAPMRRLGDSALDRLTLGQEAEEEPATLAAPPAGEGGPRAAHEAAHEAPAAPSEAKHRASTAAGTRGSGTAAHVDPTIETRREETLDELEAALAELASSASPERGDEARARLAALRARLVAIAAQWASTTAEGAERPRNGDDGPAAAEEQLRAIAKLLEQGRRRDAEWDMARFRSRYPTAVVSPEMQRRFEP